VSALDSHHNVDRAVAQGEKLITADIAELLDVGQAALITGPPAWANSSRTKVGASRSLTPPLSQH
jgi:hypothetical protein